MEYFGDGFGGKALPAVNFIAERRRNLTLRGYGKFNVAARPEFCADKISSRVNWRKLKFLTEQDLRELNFKIYTRATKIYLSLRRKLEFQNLDAVSSGGKIYRLLRHELEF